MAISKRQLKRYTEAVKEATDLEQLIGKSTELKGRKRSDLRGRCPLHGGDNPTSLSVNAKEGVWTCHSCDRAGDAIRWVQELKGVEFAQARDILAKRAGIDKPTPAWNVGDYCKYMPGIDLDFLRDECGITERGDGGVLIPYRDEDGTLLRHRVRFNKKKRWWQAGEDHGGDGSYLYGLDRLEQDTDRPVVIVEGETDCQVLWWCNWQAAGAPGQSIFKTKWVRYLPPVEKVFVLREDDGELPETVAEAVGEADLPQVPQVFAFELQQDDIRDLWKDTLSKGQFSRRLDAAIEAATPVEPDGIEDLPQHERLYQLAKLNTIAVFPEATDRRPFAIVNEGGRQSVYEVVEEGSSQFRGYLLRLYRERFNETPNAEATRRVLAQIAADTAVEDVRELHLRTAWETDGEQLLVDAGDRERTAYRVSADGYEREGQPPAVFRRFNHIRRLPEPEAGGDLSRIFDFIPVSDEGDRLLLKTFIVAAFIPNIPRPVLLVTGPQGSGKSFACRLIRRLIDPSSAEIIQRPREQKDLLQALAHNFVVPFDNMTSIPTWVSDILCASITGVGYMKRKLFSDDQDVVFQFKRVVMLNGIVNMAKRADLLDRCLHIELERLRAPKPEKKLLPEFERARPQLLGAAFNALGSAMRERPNLPDLNLNFRMADFAEWGRAIAISLGYTDGDFIAAYDNKIETAHEEAIEANPFAMAIRIMLDETDRWQGTASELLAKAEIVAENESIDTESKAWPGSASWAKRRLEEARVDLESVGIEFHSVREENRRRLVLERVGTRDSPGQTSDGA